MAISDLEKLIRDNLNWEMCSWCNHKCKNECEEYTKELENKLKESEEKL